MAPSLKVFELIIKNGCCKILPIGDPLGHQGLHAQVKKAPSPSTSPKQTRILSAGVVITIHWKLYQVLMQLQKAPVSFQISFT